jgi:nucleoside-diphosphate-sugar epimerase|tara:strand:+ start:2069 stop:2923 length:855 start_codon:yes stop_codon:yes gene_type:complete
MKILVTGATGFIGSNLIKVLLKNKSNQIIATSRNIKKAKNFDWFSKVTYYEYDLNNSTNKDLYSFFDKPNQLIHLAWDKVSDVKDLVHIEEILFDHFKFIKNMIAGGLKDIVVAGTCFEYGMIEGCLSEDLDTKPSNSYGIAKDTLRKFIIELKENFSFQYKWIRIFYVYGEGQSKRSLFYLLDKAIKNKDKQFNMSGGEQLRDYLYISELTKYICLIADQNIYVDKIINCCSGNPRSVKDLVQEYLKDKDYNISLNLGYYPYRDFEPMAFWGDRTNLENLLKL